MARKPKSTQPPPHVELPEWIDREAWDGYLEMRQLIKKPATARALVLCVKTLQKLRAAGHDPNEVLDQSTQASWQGLFPLKHPTTKTAAPAADDQALVAWNEVRAASRADGRAPTRGWTDLRTGPALEAIGGFHRLADMRTDQVGFVMREFVAQFRIVQPARPSNVVPITQQRRVA